MSSSLQQGPDGSQSPPPAIPPATVAADSPEENALTTAAAASASAATVAESPPPSKPSPPEKTATRRGNKERHQKQSKAQSPAQRGISPVPSFSQAVTTAHVLGIGTQQATTPNLLTSTAAAPSSAQTAAGSRVVRIMRAQKKKRDKEDFKDDAPPSTVQLKEAAAAEPSCVPADAGPVYSASLKGLKAATSTHPPGKRKLKQRSTSTGPDILKALASLKPAPEEEAARKHSVKGMKALLDVRAEPPSSSDRTSGTSVHAHLKVSLGAKVVATAIIAMTILAFVFLLYPKPKQESVKYCTTKDCEEHIYRIANQLDKGIDPCDDFGAHVCGRWRPRNKHTLSRSEMSDMYLSWLRSLPERLNKGFRQFPVGKKVAVMYNRCLMQKGSQIDTFKKFMRARGIFWPERPPKTVPLVKILTDLAFNWNVNFWFSLKILPSISKEKPRHIFLAPNKLMLLWKDTFSQLSKENFGSVYSTLYKIFSNDTSRQPNQEGISTTYNVLKLIFNTSVPPCPCEARVPGLFPLRAIDSKFRIPIGSHVMDTLNNAAGIDPPVTMDDLVLVSDKSQFANMLRILNQFDDLSLRSHLSWLFVQEYGSVAFPSAVLLVIHGSENRADQERPRFCAAQAESSYKLLVAAMASAGLFSEEERHRINDQLASIVKEATYKTLAVSWLDNETKQVAVEKLANVRTVLWPSKQFLAAEALRKVYANFTFNASSFAEYWIETRRSQRLMFGSEAAEEELLLGDSTQLPYAEYEQVLNHLSLSFGALAPPLYYKNGTNAMLHGGLLYFYARALIPAIDNEGVKIDPQGNIVPSWLSNSTQDIFDQRTQRCLPGNTSIFPEVPAMEVAYGAFKRHHLENNSRLSEGAVSHSFAQAAWTSCLNKMNSM
ncbi:neprilysin-like isoform X2 [Dermacentor albipictus]|uniref:neprilysin-like isoform X2 n=1 Tax=Dermacentor albipictus TaxID=60249 RepID=UPI0031FBFA06